MRFMPRPDGLKRLSDEVAAALLQAMATLPDPARDGRLLLRPARWIHANASEDEFYVFCRGKRVGHILHSRWYGSEELPWVWGIDGTKILGRKAATREQAMADFRKAWDAEHQDGRTA